MGSSSSKAQTVGYKYHLGIHMILCHGPIDAITRVDVDGKVAWTGKATSRISINKPDLFGGEEREGGVSGEVDVALGAVSQGRNDYLQGRLGSAIPAFRGVVGAILRQCYVGMNPYIKRWAFWGQRILVRQDGIPQWYIAKAAIGQDMNPAHIIRECLTDPDWGMGYPEEDIDEDTFRAAADQLFSEGMGMSLLWDRSMELKDFIQEVLKHIHGSVFVDRSSGKFKLKLARGGYNIDTLLVLDESSIERVSDFKRNTVGELTNSITVVYWDASTGQQGSVTVQDIALAAQQQATVGTTMQYTGFTNGTIATRVAARDLKALSTPLAGATIYATRKAAGLNIGDLFVFSWPRFGVEKMVMRVSNVELGTLGSNIVKITAAEDVFALSEAIYAPPPPSGWTPPHSAPAPVPYQIVMEAPYWELVQRIGETNAQGISADTGYIVTTGTRPVGDAINSRIFSSTSANSGYEQGGTADFCPSALLGVAIGETETVLSLTSGEDLSQVAVDSYVALNNEIMSVVSITDTTMTVKRGLLDTIPQSHAANSRFFFYDDFCETDTFEYAVGETAYVKLCPVTGQGTLELASAPARSTLIQGRAARPYPPGRVRLNTVAYPTSLSGQLSITWAHRSRTQQTTGAIIDQDYASIGPEDKTRYGLRFLNASNNSVLAEKTDVSGTEATAVLNFTGNVTMELYSITDNGPSLMRHRRTFAYTPPAGTTASTITAGTYVPDSIIFDGGGA
ncbi:hypothetical protein 19_00028 [Pseudomonas phage Epa19]|nr:hypothetical protein 19_00028 [Pseudomonas phage Epa19]